MNNRTLAHLAILLPALLLSPALLSAQEKEYPTSAIGQIPDLKSIPDSTAAFQKQIDDNGGTLRFDKSGFYRITKTLDFDLAKHSAAKVQGSAGVTLIMDGPGPALRFTGSHEGTAGPTTFVPTTWNESMPIVTGIEILGNHPEADGLELFQTVQAVISRVAIRWCRHGIHLVTRNRNVVVSDCHLYENSGVGLYLDALSLHQINVSNSHISYNRQGGIVVRDGNVRNLQVTGCDLEGNMPGDPTPTKAANILIDVSGTPDDRSHSVAEVAITGCTIQHSSNYSKKKDDAGNRIAAAPGGANIRLLGKEIYPIDTVTITGNLLSDTETNLEIIHAHDVTVASNTFFAPGVDHLHVRNSQRVALSGNTFNPRQFERPGALRFKDSADCVLSASTIHAATNETSVLSLENCSGFIINAVSFTSNGSGILLNGTSDSTISNCRVSGTAKGAADLTIDSSNKNITLSGNAFSGTVDIDAAAKAK